MGPKNNAALHLEAVLKVAKAANLRIITDSKTFFPTSQPNDGRYPSGRSGRLRPESRIRPRVSALRVPATNAKARSNRVLARTVMLFGQTLTATAKTFIGHNHTGRKNTSASVPETALSPIEQLNQNLSSTGSTVSSGTRASWARNAPMAYGLVDDHDLHETAGHENQKQVKNERVAVSLKGEFIPFATPPGRVKSTSQNQEFKSEKVVLWTMKDLNGKHGTPRKLARATKSTKISQLLEIERKSPSDTALCFCLLFDRQSFVSI